MAYNDFTLEALKRQFDLRTHEGSDLFGQVAPVSISHLLRETLRESVPLALDISTDKARSELIIAPVLTSRWTKPSTTSARWNGSWGFWWKWCERPERRKPRPTARDVQFA
jgi:hypothetical protein